ncbi:DUF1214 domain-containing protein [Camelimonas abortus]|uniref:DUF1214 domain-containing protein n=1 Tax=Camelimonas abortus TaxID=1017184 RepID=A0ABV7LHR2_9HYPH
MELVAEHDSDGQPLRGGCVYEITGRTPEARIWTLAATPLRPDGTAAPAGPAAPLAQPRALTSEGLLRDPDGGVRIAVAATPQPGDWIAAPPSGRFRLTLRLYDSPTGFISRPDMSEQLTPAIRRKRCA